MQKNIKFKRVVNFSITALEETTALAGTNCKMNCEFVAQRKGYKQVVSVMQTHPDEPDFCKKSCVILKQLLKECDDPQLPYRIIEAGCPEALQKIIETPPEKDEETKQLVLEILNYLFTVKGVLHKVVVKHGTGVLKMFMNTNKPKLAKNVIDCLQNMASEGLDSKDNDSLAKMNSLVLAHQNDLGVNQSGSSYIKNLFENTRKERLANCPITIKDIVRSFGPYNMDEQIFRNLDVAIDKLGSEKEVNTVLASLVDKPTSDDFWILSHLIDLPSIDMKAKKPQVAAVVKSIEDKGLASKLNSEVCFLLKELHRARPDIAKEIMKDKTALIKRIMDEVDVQTGAHKYLGLQVLTKNIEQHSKFMRDNDLIKKAEKWINECQVPEDMVSILTFLAGISEEREMRKDVCHFGLDNLSIKKTKTFFPAHPKTFDALVTFMDKCLYDEATIKKFCDIGNTSEILNLGTNQLDDIDITKLVDFTTRMYEITNVSEKLMDSFNQATKLFCTQFERRIAKFFEDWFERRNDKEIWNSKYKPPFLESVATKRERNAIKKMLYRYDTQVIEAALKKSTGEKGSQALELLSQHMATFTCVLVNQDYDSGTIMFRNSIGDSINALRANLEFITEKVIKSRVISRYAAMFCSLLPFFKQKSYIKKIAQKKSEFPCVEFIQFAEIAMPKQPVIPFQVISAYGLYFIPEDLRPETAKVVDTTDSSSGQVTYQLNAWSPLTFILSDAHISPPITDVMAHWTKKRPEQSIYFVGYTALRVIYEFGTQDIDMLLESTLLNNLMNLIDEGTLDTNLATSAIFCMDDWCEGSEKALIRLCAMSAYEKLVRYMNNLKNLEILKIVISSLLQKLCNHTDGAQLEVSLEKIVKKCKEYDDICATKGDEKREECLVSYNELAGLLGLTKAQQFCLMKNLQSTTMNTLNTELKRLPDELMKNGLIVTYQDFLNKLVIACNALYGPAKAKATPQDILALSHILKKAVENWRYDVVLMKGILDLVRLLIKSKGQLEYNPEISKKIIADLDDFAFSNKNSTEIAQAVKDVQTLLDPAAAKKEIKVDVVAPAPIPISGPPMEILNLLQADNIQHLLTPPPIQEIKKEEEEKHHLKENFISESILSVAIDHQNDKKDKEVEAKKAHDEAVPKHLEQPKPAPVQSAPGQFDLNNEEDCTKALGVLHSKETNPDDTSHDEVIKKLQAQVDSMDLSELQKAIFYAKWTAALGAIPSMAPQIGNPFPKLKANLDKFQGHPDLLRATCNASATPIKDNPAQFANYIQSDLATSQRTFCLKSSDPATLVFFAQTVTNSATNEESKIAITKKAVISVLAHCFVALKKENEATFRPIFKAVNSLCSSKVTAPMNLEKTDFLDKLVGFSADSIAKVPLVILILETFGNIFRNGGANVRAVAVESGATQFFVEVFLALREENSVMKHFYPAASNVGELNFFWRTLDSVSFTDYTFSKLVEYPLEICCPAMVCLILLTKMEDIADKVVFTGLYRWMDPALKKHNDNTLLSYLLVIANSITATLKRQIKLTEERYYEVAMQYHQEVIQSKNEKLLMLWLGVLCRLTNSIESCNTFMDYLYPYLDGQLREFYYNEPVFEKFYNLMTNILIGSQSDPNLVDSLIQVTFHKLSVNTHTENLYMMWVNYIEKMVWKTKRQDIQAVLEKNKDAISTSMQKVPLLLTHTSEGIQKKFNVKFPRKVQMLALQNFVKSNIDPKTTAQMIKGHPCKRYRPGAIIESGTFFVDRQLKHLVFQRNSSLCVQSRDIIFFGDIIKVVKGYDERSCFIEAMKKYNLTLNQDHCMMVLSSKISYGETGFYLQFQDEAPRKFWKDILKVILTDLGIKK